MSEFEKSVKVGNSSLAHNSLIRTIIDREGRKTKEILFIFNPVSGNGYGNKYIELIKEWYDIRDVKIVVWRTAQSGPDSAFNLGKRALECGFEKVGIIGGDGTYHLVFNGMMAAKSRFPQRNLPLTGFFCAGTGCNFAKNAGVPFDFVDAIQAFDDEYTVGIDFGKLILPGEEKYILNSLDVGYGALVTKLAKDKGWSYAHAAVFELIARGAGNYCISLNGKDEIPVFLFSILNGPTYGKGFIAVPNANPYDRELDVLQVAPMPRFKALASLPRLISGTHVSMKEVTIFRISSLKISSGKPLPFHVDGETSQEGEDFQPQKEFAVQVLSGFKIIVSKLLLTAQRPLFIQTPVEQFA